MVESLHRVPGTHRVYNLTVEGEHVYRVAELGALVHNNDCKNLKLERYGSELEAKRTLEKGGLHVDADLNGKYKNIGKSGTVDAKKLGKRNRYSHRIEIEADSKVQDFFRKHKLEPPLGHEDAYQIPADLVDEFNTYIKNITVSKR